MHKFINSITLTDGLVEHAGFSAIELDDLPRIDASVPGGYTSANITVDQWGRVTAASNGSGGGGGMAVGSAVTGGRSDGSLLFINGSGNLAISTDATSLSYVDSVSLVSVNVSSINVGGGTPAALPGAIGLYDATAGIRIYMWCDANQVTFTDASANLQSVIFDQFLCFGGTFSGTVSINFPGAANTFIIKANASQGVDLQRWESSGSTILSRITKDGYFVTRKTSAIATGDLVANEVALWLDATAGAPVVNFKGKDSAGTVFTATVGGGGGGSSILTGTYASLPAAGTAGRLYYPSDGAGYHLYDNGASWDTWVCDFGPFNPGLADFGTWVNQNSWTIDTSHGVVQLAHVSASGSDQLTARVKTTGGLTTWQMRLVFRHNSPPASIARWGIFLRESGSGKIMTFMVDGIFNNPQKMNVFTWSNATGGFNSTIGNDLSAPNTLPQPVMLQMRANGTTFFFEYSIDGIYWYEYTRLTIAGSYLAGYDQIGYGCDLQTAGNVNETFSMSVYDAVFG